jgi:hypothetical protein
LPYRSTSANQSRNNRRNTADIVSPAAAAFTVAGTHTASSHLNSRFGVTGITAPELPPQ